MDFLFPNKNNQDHHTDLITESLRVNFAKKVYGILSIQLLATSAFSFISMTNRAFLIFQIENIWLLYFTLILGIIISIAMICNRQLVRQYPTNYIILGLFTLCQSYGVSFSCALADPEIVFQAAFLTLAITLGLTVYAMTTKKDFTIMGGIVFSAYFAILPLLFILSFTKATFAQVLIEAVGIFMAAFYLIYDTQLIMGGKRTEIGIDDYILASFILYQDIIMLFLKLLEILSKQKDDKEKDKKKK